MNRNWLVDMLFNDDSDDEFDMFSFAVIEEEEIANGSQSTRRGSTPGYAVIQRGRVEGDNRFYRDYFAETPTFGPHLFRRTFRMHRPLFLRIQHAVEHYDPYFVQTRNAAGILGLSLRQKITAAFRMLAYGAAADFVDEYVRIGESTAIESLKKFVKAVVAVFSDEYLRSPNNDDVARLLAINNARGFLGMLGSIDCMHWKWKNCPGAWQGSLNNINVFDRSNVFNDLAEGRAPICNYSVSGHEYSMGYYLADGIYPSWSTFVKTIPSSQGNKNKHFAACQESARKDVERAFGVLQSRFAIVRGPGRYWDQETLNNIMKACIIMHNMIVEDEREIGQLDYNYDTAEENPPANVSHERVAELHQFMENHRRIRDRQTHSQLQTDLIEHLWEKHGVN